MHVICGKHVNVLVVCNEPCVIGSLSLVRLIGHSGCPGIGEIAEPGPAALPGLPDGANGMLLPRNRHALASQRGTTCLTGTPSFTLRTFRMDITGISGEKVVTRYVK
jgi:hypothetical protein